MRSALAAVACLALFGLGAVGCAHVEAPRGGPEMRDSLRLAEVQPDSLAVVPGLRGPVAFTFNARLSERGLDDAVLVSPRTGPVVVGHRGSQLRVSLRGGWEPERIYQVTVLPAIQDLWNNRLHEPVTHVFSTGPEIPDTRLEGRAIDRITGRPEVGIRVEAIRAADSLVYAARTDSAGAFVIARVPEGDYRVRAFRDVNRNRALDPFEPRDTADASLVAGQPEEVRFSVVMPDTTPPVVASARIAQENVEVQFDDYLDPEQTVGPDQVSLVDAAGTAVAIRRVAVGRLAPDAAPDTVPADTLPAEPPQAGPPGTPTPAEPLPSQTLVVQPAAPLAPETEYTITIRGVRNVVGLEGGGEASFTTPAAAPPPEPEPPEPAPGP